MIYGKPKGGLIKDLILDYKKKRPKIKSRLKDFSKVWKSSEKDIFAELCFCICTPQAKAVSCDKAVSGLKRNNVLYKGSLSQIRKGLQNVRFPNNKSKYIYEARKFLTVKGSIKLKEKIDVLDIKQTREWLVKNIKGIGFKEASHFLRNIGLGRDIAILDVHILKNMVRYGMIAQRPKGINCRIYLSLEESMKKFSQKVGIPLDELDLLFWSSETGEIFK